MDVTALIDELIEREGGFVDHPADRGGPTKYGITEGLARLQRYEGAMRDLPRAFAAQIYREVFWETPSLDQVAKLAPRLAAELFDTGVNMGRGVAGRFLQRALNGLNRGGRDYADIKVDGIIGPGTLKALSGFIRTRGEAGETVLLKAVEALQGERYLRLAELRPANEAFLYGWLANRIG